MSKSYGLVALMIVCTIAGQAAAKETFVMPTVKLTPSNMPHGFDLGDPAAGIVVGVAILDGEEIGPQGLVSLRPTLPEWQKLQAAMKAEIFPDAPIYPPKRYVKEYTLSLDERAFATIKAHPWWGPLYTLSLPYRPKNITVGMTLSTGESYSRTIQVDEAMLFDRAYDTRAQEKIDKPGDVVQRCLVSPYRNQVGTRIVFPGVGCRELTVLLACAGSKKAGRIVHSSLILKKHPRFAPEGDRLLRETRYHQPVYLIGEMVTLKARLAAGMEDAIADVEVVARCDTEEGRTFTETFTHDMPGERECRLPGKG